MLKQRTAERSHAYKGGYYIKNIPAYDTYAHKISFCEEVKRNKQDQNILEVKCAYCGKWYVPTRIAVHSRAQAMNGEMSSGSEHRFYCSDNCKQECPIFHKIKYPKGFKPATSREVQPQLRQLVFERDNYTCQKCDKTQDELETGLHCHHLTGVEINPIESADVDNCIALCKNCHIEIHKLPGCGYNDFKRKKCKN
jgi:5-methylcytosine-specific restriction endonuclease McrA